MEYNLCKCGVRKDASKPYCGGCPRPRANPENLSAYLDENGNDLPSTVRCSVPKCRAILHLSIMPGHETYSPEHVKCLECFKEQGPYSKERMEGCSFSKHYPPDRRQVPSASVDWYAIPHPRKDHDRKRVCFRCAYKHKLQTWRDYAISKGTHVEATGEIIPMIQQTGNLFLSPDSQDRLPGGRARRWAPKPGIEGSRIIRDGVPYAQEILFTPERFESIRIGRTDYRVIVADWTPEATPEGFMKAAKGTLWHGGLNAWLDRLVETMEARGRRRDLSHVGLCYARLDGVHANTERHRLIASSLQAFKLEQNRETGETPTMHQWLQWCQQSREVIP